MKLWISEISGATGIDKETKKKIKIGGRRTKHTGRKKLKYILSDGENSYVFEAKITKKNLKKLLADKLKVVDAQKEIFQKTNLLTEKVLSGTVNKFGDVTRKLTRKRKKKTIFDYESIKEFFEVKVKSTPDEIFQDTFQKSKSKFKEGEYFVSIKFEHEIMVDSEFDYVQYFSALTNAYFEKYEGEFKTYWLGVSYSYEIEGMSQEMKRYIDVQNDVSIERIQEVIQELIQPLYAAQLRYSVNKRKYSFIIVLKD